MQKDTFHRGVCYNASHNSGLTEADFLAEHKGTHPELSAEKEVEELKSAYKKCLDKEGVKPAKLKGADK